MKVLIVILSICGSALTFAAASPLNIVFILADDMGWADLGCYGADLHETPRIDQFAEESVRFTNAYAMSVCSPTRATLLTGKHAARVRFTIWAEGAEGGGPKNRPLRDAASIWDLPHEETTLAERLRDAGYLTALVGKWHLGGWQHYPETHGFDINIGGTGWGAPQTFWWPYSGNQRFGGEFRYVPDLEFGKPGEYLTDRLTDEALKVIDHAGKQPFFLFLSHHSVHTPIEAKEEDVAHFDAKLEPGMNHQHGVYAAMMKNFDDNVGRVLDHLKDRGLEETTLVIFASDNGGFIGADKASGRDMPVTNNHPLRSGKGSLYEGGIRIPLIIRWPGATRAGTVCDEPVITMDLFSTMLAAAGLPSEADDGVDLTPLLKDPPSALGRDALFFHYPHYYPTTSPVSAIRDGDWKLLEFFEDDHIELYNLREDLSEQRDLAEEKPEVVHSLREKLHAWRDSVDAALPTSNPDFKSQKDRP